MLRSEINLELELQAAGEESGWVLPAPDPSGAPRIDGDLADPFWSGATVLLWETAGNSLFRDGAAWRIFVARAEGALCVGASAMSPPSSTLEMASSGRVCA